MKPYTIIEHTADAGIRTSGKTREELFRNAGLGMTEIMVNNLKEKGSLIRHLSVAAPNEADLLLIWLKELLYLFSSERFLFTGMKYFSIDNEFKLEADIEGVTLDSTRHELGLEIKAVTYHQFEYKKTGEGYTAQIIFDV